MLPPPLEKACFCVDDGEAVVAFVILLWKVKRGGNLREDNKTTTASE